MRIVTKLVALAVLAVAGFAQSASELLQKGIYTQETAGDLDGAIQIYRQIISSSPPQHEIAAEAQYRLAQALIRKGDLTGAALEFQTLARDYSEYQALISRIPAQDKTLHINFTPAALTTEFDASQPVSVTGVVTQMTWINPRGWIHLKDGAGNEWTIATASPQQLMAQQFTKATVKLGDQITVNGSLGKDGSKTAIAETIYSAAGVKLFERASLPDLPSQTPQQSGRFFYFVPEPK